MSLIDIAGLTFCYEGSYDNVFEHVFLQLDTDWKLGFVGRNGRGKTTFLQLLLGKYAYRGSIRAQVAFDYFPYDVPDICARTQQVLKGVCPDAPLWTLRRELSLLKVRQDALARPFDTLSHGERTKVLLAALFCNEGRFLLIDEPTNHLDMAARALLGDYLAQKKGFILVSHDRDLLDRCTDHTLALNRADIQLQHGNFSAWWQNKAMADAFELDQDKKLRRDIGRLAQASRRTAGWSAQSERTKFGQGPVDRGFIGHKAAKVMKRAKAIEARRQQEIAQKATLLKNIEHADALAQHPLPHPKAVLVQATDLCIRYEEQPVCGPLRFTLRQGERLALCGGNGSGKSSVLKLLLGQSVPHSGTLQCASGCKISYVAQDTSFLQGTLHAYAQARGLDESLLLTILRKLDFARVQFEKDMSAFSAGQKKKVLLAASLSEQAHLYVWDEPLNFVDVYTRMQLEDLLLRARATLLFVEHDRAFVDHVATGRIEC
nr:ATP-binding cassette domain-containing protein [Maliibacterium massiliense]